MSKNNFMVIIVGVALTLVACSNSKKKAVVPTPGKPAVVVDPNQPTKPKPASKSSVITVLEGTWIEDQKHCQAYQNQSADIFLKDGKTFNPYSYGSTRMEFTVKADLITIQIKGFNALDCTMRDSKASPITLSDEGYLIGVKSEFDDGGEDNLFTLSYSEDELDSESFSLTGSNRSTAVFSKAGDNTSWVFNRK